MAMPRRTRWADLSPRGRAFVVVAAAAEIVLTTIAMRDLSRRPRTQVRGPKWLWRLVSLVQPVGPVAYLLLGRRDA